jgi:hypothetical protein
MKGKDNIGNSRGMTFFCISALPTRQPGKKKAK